MKKVLFLLAFIALALTSCNNKNKGVEDENVTYVEDNDQEMNIAMDNARKTFDQFEKAFIDNQKSNKYVDFIIKEGFPTKDGLSKEHMWVVVLTYNGKDFTGIVSNDPLYETEVQNGDTITVDRNLISDWMYTDNTTNQTYGGYTTRIFVNRMNDTERAAFLQQNGFDFAPLSE